MPAILVKYSFLWVSACLLFLAGAWLWGQVALSWLLKLGICLGMLLILAGIFVVLRPRPSSTEESISTVEAKLNNGRPTLLELYSEY